MFICLNASIIQWLNKLVDKKFLGKKMISFEEKYIATSKFDFSRSNPE